MNKNIGQELLALAATAALVLLNEHPDALRYAKPAALKYGARIARNVAESGWRIAMRLENEYAKEVAH